MLKKKVFIIEDKIELYMFFINCLEDLIFEKISVYFRNDELNYLEEEGCFFKVYFLVSWGWEFVNEVLVEYL